MEYNYHELLKLGLKDTDRVCVVIGNNYSYECSFRWAKIYEGYDEDPILSKTPVRFIIKS